MEHASYFNEFLRDEVNINRTRLDQLSGRVDSVYAALIADDTIGHMITGKTPQGSWPHRLIIKPKSGGEFDADFLLEMNEQAGWEPKRYPNEVYNALDRHSTYCKQVHGRKCRCVYLKYADDNGVACHLDIVPFIALTDGRRVIVNRDDNDWEPKYGSTDPAAFSDWIARRDEMTDGHFRRAVRIMKYLKLERGSFNGVKSVVLTTLLGTQVTEHRAIDAQAYKNLPTTLLTILEDLDKWLPATKPHLPNPNTDGTNFDHRWTEETYQNFRTRVGVIATDMRAAYDEPDKAKSIAAWQAILGDKFTPPPPKTSSNSGNPFAVSAAGNSSRSSRLGRAG